MRSPAWYSFRSCFICDMLMTFLSRKLRDFYCRAMTLLRFLKVQNGAQKCELGRRKMKKFRVNLNRNKFNFVF